MKKINKKTICIITAISILFCIIKTILHYNNSHYEQMGTLLYKKAYHQAILLDNNNVLITGGITSLQEGKNGSKIAEIYSIDNKTSEQINNTNLPHVFHKMFKTENGNIVIADTDGIEIFNTKTKKFKLLKTKPIKRYKEFYNYKYELLPNNLLLILGGRHEIKTNIGLNLVDLNVGEIIDIKNDRLVKRFTIEGNGFGVIKLNDGNVLILGGKKNDGTEEKLLNSIYLFNIETMKLENWGVLDTPLANPFMFLTQDDKVIIIGGEIFNKQEKALGFNFLYTKGNTDIITLNLKTREIKTRNFLSILKHKDIYNNQILDVVQYSDNIYWLQLRANNKDNSILVDVRDMIKHKNTFHKITDYTMRYRSSNIKVPDGILISGGKFLYEEATEYCIDSEQIPHSKERYLPTGGGLLENNILMLRIK